MCQECNDQVFRAILREFHSRIDQQIFSRIALAVLLGIVVSSTVQLVLMTSYQLRVAHRDFNGVNRAICGFYHDIAREVLYDTG